MRYSTWLIMAAVLMLAACGSREPDAPDIPSPVPQSAATVEVVPAPPLPALVPVPRSPIGPSPTPVSLPTRTAGSAEPTPAAEDTASQQVDVRTLYVPDTSPPVPATPAPRSGGQPGTPPPTATPETLEPAETRSIMLSTLGQSWESAGQGITLADVLALFETGYILTTGHTPEQDGWSPLVLSGGEYIEFVTTRHPDDPGFQQATSYCCEVTGDGIQTVVNGDASPGTVLTSLAHEAGHALQRINNPSQNGHARDSNVGAVREAQAYAFEAALMRALGVHGRLDVSTLLIGPETDEYIDRWRARWMDKRDDLRFEHERGFLILWLAALADTRPGGAAEQIASPRRMLDSETLLGLHRALVALKPGDVDGYVDSLMQNLSDSLNVITGTLSIRATQLGSYGSVEDSHAPYVVP